MKRIILTMILLVLTFCSPILASLEDIAFSSKNLTSPQILGTYTNSSGITQVVSLVAVLTVNNDNSKALTFSLKWDNDGSALTMTTYPKDIDEQAITKPSSTTFCWRQLTSIPIENGGRLALIASSNDSSDTNVSGTIYVFSHNTVDVTSVGLATPLGADSANHISPEHQFLRKNVSGQKAYVYARDNSTGAPKTGDAANITAYIGKDAGTPAATNDTNPTEWGADLPGFYYFNLTQAETNADFIVIDPNSATSDIEIRPVMIHTIPVNSAGKVIIPFGRFK